MFKGTITKIHLPKYSRNGGNFIRLEFKLEGGEWAKTDLVMAYRNFSRWKNLLEVGADLDGLELKSKGEVNADSYPRLITPKVRGDWKQMPDGSMEFITYQDEIKPLEELKPQLTQPKLI